ncbi:hypothetical protein UYSO10_4364 [Kosakonia radicincitans]|nr:hypothetical protein UYSO10_4364 [Kosakonia radicincitans]
MRAGQPYPTFKPLKAHLIQLSTIMKASGSGPDKVRVLSPAG